MQDKNMRCPLCGSNKFDPLDFIYLVMLDEHKGIAQYRCPSCGQLVTAYMPLSDEILAYAISRLSILEDKEEDRDQALSYAAFKEALQAKMGFKDSSASVEKFHCQLEKLYDVDDLLEEIRRAKQKDSSC